MDRAFKNLEFELLGEGKSDLENYFRRDSIMFRNIVSLIEEKAKTVIIRGHNLHMNKMTLDRKLFGQNKTLGQLLDNHFQERFFSIATSIGKGKYYAGVDSINLKVKEHPQKLGNIFEKLTEEKFGYLDIDGSVRKTLNRSDFFITSGTGKSFLTQVDSLGNAFDGLIFIKNSTPFKFFNDLDFFTLYLDLSEREMRRITKKEEAKIAFNYRFHSETEDAQVCLKLFFHDYNEEQLAKHNFCSSKSISIVEQHFTIPTNTKLVSLSFDVTRAQNIVIDEFFINDKSYNRFKLHDWNMKGYRLTKELTSLTVRK